MQEDESAFGIKAIFCSSSLQLKLSAWSRTLTESRRNELTTDGSDIPAFASRRDTAQHFDTSDDLVAGSWPSYESAV